MTSTSLRLGALGLALSLLAACGGDSPTGPTTADIAGTWRITFTNMSGSGVTCGTSAIDYVVSQSGDTFSGTSNSTYTLSCTDGVSSGSEVLTGSIITNGHVSGSAISFDLATSAAHQTGAISGNSVSGSATWTIDLGTSGSVVLRGQFGGARL
jgi:hypothetical protein